MPTTLLISLVSPQKTGGSWSAVCSSFFLSDLYAWFKQERYVLTYLSVTWQDALADYFGFGCSYGDSDRTGCFRHLVYMCRLLIHLSWLVSTFLGQFRSQYKLLRCLQGCTINKHTLSIRTIPEWMCWYLEQNAVWASLESTRAYYNHVWQLLRVLAMFLSIASWIISEKYIEDQDYGGLTEFVSLDYPVKRPDPGGSDCVACTVRSSVSRDGGESGG